MNRLSALIFTIGLFAGFTQVHAETPHLPFGELASFTTDGCTDFPNGTFEEPTKWLHCCIEHDAKYWVGGSKTERLLADKQLRACVAETGRPDIAEIMFLGVRVGGSPFLQTNFRWGYGWQEMRGYTPLNSDEAEQFLRLKPEDVMATPAENAEHFRSPLPAAIVPSY